jgi:hypothetical protein
MGGRVCVIVKSNEHEPNHFPCEYYFGSLRYDAVRSLVVPLHVSVGFVG